MKNSFRLGVFKAMVAGFSANAALAADLGTAFTYQGRLVKDGTAVTDTCSFTFGLWDAATLGAQKGTSPQSVPGVAVADGLFTVSIDFGADGIDGTARWLEITVDCGAAGGPGDASATTLVPRQELKPAPHALALPGLYTQQNAFSPNLIGGFNGNMVTGGAVGATIGGGGVVGSENRGENSFVTIGGGVGNTGGGINSTVGGGNFNTASGQSSTVGGGVSNTASGVASTVGGSFNIASGDASTVGGGNSNLASAHRATIGGGDQNTASGQWSTVGGGKSNASSAAYATIAGGGESTPGNSATANRVTDDYGTVGGGGNNQAGDNAGTTADQAFATVGGGQSNTASGLLSIVGGGDFNTASGSVSTVGGGGSNTASASFSTVVGGTTNTASANYSTIGGGTTNIASGNAATVPGGDQNTAGGNFSFAAGRRAKVRSGDEGTFVWADSFLAPFQSTGPNQFLIRASGGVGIGTASPAHPLQMGSGAHVTAGGVWTDASSRKQKENFSTIDPLGILAGVVGLPLTRWNYKNEDTAITHLGPVAEDFRAAFGTGPDAQHLAALDTAGVALAAIQGLHQIVQEKDCEIDELQDRNRTLETRLAAIEAAVGQLLIQRKGD